MHVRAVCELRGRDAAQLIHCNLETLVDADGGMAIEMQFVIPRAFAMVPRIMPAGAATCGRPDS